MSSKSTLGILGAGKLGITLGRLATNAGYPVVIAGSSGVEKIELTIEILVPGATPMTSPEVIEQADIIVLALPLSKMESIPVDSLGNKVVFDAMNYWWEVDGTERIPADPSLSSSEYVANYLKSTRVVKAFNHMGYHDLEHEAHSDEAKVIALAGDDTEAKETVSTFIEELGFVPIDIGALSEGMKLEPGSELFGANLNKEQFVEVLVRLS